MIERKTGETDVRLSLTLDGTGVGARETGVGFLDHMLDLLARHGRMDLDVSVSGDLETGAHHTAEDTAIVLGQALDGALGERKGIVRYGSATVPMDEARASCALDISGRPFTAFDADLPPGSTGGSARFASMLSPRHFRRRMAEVRVQQGAAKLAAAGAPIARAEGFEVHAESMEARVRENQGE